MSAFIGILIYLIGLISPVVYKKIESKYSENKDKNIEDYREKIEMKQKYYSNFFPIYQRTYALMYEVLFCIERFKKCEYTFKFSNENAKKILNLDEESYSKYMYGEDSDYVYKINWQLTLQQLSDYIIDLREVNMKNEILYSEIEHNLIKHFLILSNETMFSLREMGLNPEEKSLDEKEIQEIYDKLDSLMNDVKIMFKERFLIE
ncbi:hypothetical protein QI060_07000 [Staphylococcus saprophyticus]|uniref:hypothetical protein n=1 Tax=Staphylococcus TaxID=1279 RepID=UPI001950460C|nr:hypothetical protein [Staphylococcus sp. GFQ9D221P]MDW4166534.1 hypothetical protein [Staphylococcus saprophyticus]MDW4210832.1 hypothetical protein [Staphylococcus saprophyticus]MDW4302054.1 hypothetical protein [Staphylococcus saprophyticus]MDW4357014.1 hypothetical protein [Staphylococcus saprophyticus]MDW4460276.1 hypothetical protein [Staphylococcus saprophyticus]